MGPFGGNGAEGESGWSREQRGGARKGLEESKCSIFVFVCISVCVCARWTIVYKGSSKSTTFVLLLNPLSACLLSLSPLTERRRKTFISLPSLHDTMLHTFVPEGREKQIEEERKTGPSKHAGEKTSSGQHGCLKGGWIALSSLRFKHPPPSTQSNQMSIVLFSSFFINTTPEHCRFVALSCCCNHKECLSQNSTICSHPVNTLSAVTVTLYNPTIWCYPEEHGVSRFSQEDFFSLVSPMVRHQGSKSTSLISALVLKVYG